MIIYNLIFYSFALFAIISAFATVISTNPVHSVLSLIVCFFSGSGLFILLGAEFISMITIIIYVGAVAVLFLFVVMMVNINKIKNQLSFENYFFWVLILGIVFCGNLFVVFYKSTQISEFVSYIENIQSRITDVIDTKSLGLILYTEYFYCFQISGILLLASMIGAIMLTLKKNKSVKRQEINQQMMRNKNNGVRLLDIDYKKGIL